MAKETTRTDPDIETSFMPPVSAASASAPATAAPAFVPAAVDGRLEYEVTELAGPRVAGQRAVKGDVLRLTETEALAEQLSGAIVRKGEQLPEGLRPVAEANSKSL